MDIQDMKVEELKALAYDQIVILERTQNNLRVLNSRINALMQGEKKDD